MTAILWIVGISVASFFGIILYITRKRHVDYEYPVELHLTVPEVKALSDCKIGLPNRRGTIKKGSDIFIIRVSLQELHSLHARTMEAAQIRISRAAARARDGRGGMLTGTALHVSIAAGYFHSLLLEHWRRTGDEGAEPVSGTPIDGTAVAPDNPA